MEKNAGSPQVCDDGAGLSRTRPWEPVPARRCWRTSLADNKGRRYGLRRGVERKRIDAYRQMLAELGLGLEEKLNVKMGSLSGGQRQALALLMATMTPLKFLILDEHTAALDPKTAAGIMELTDRIVRKKKLTALMVTCTPALCAGLRGQT